MANLNKFCQHGISCFLLKLGRIDSDFHLLLKNLLKLRLDPITQNLPIPRPLLHFLKDLQPSAILGNYHWFHLIQSIIEEKYPFGVFPEIERAGFYIGIINLFLKKSSALFWAVWLNSLSLAYIHVDIQYVFEKYHWFYLTQAII